MPQCSDNAIDRSFAHFSVNNVQTKAEHRNYQRVASAIDYLVEHQQSQPTLGDLSSAMGSSESHLQRLFSDWAGVSPKQFLQFLTKEYAKQLLKDETVLNASAGSGLSGPGRLHDLLLKWESVTPGEIRQAGQGMVIRYGVHSTPFGYCLLAHSERGICKLGFFDQQMQLTDLVSELKSDWRSARLIDDRAAGAELCAQIFAPLRTPGKRCREGSAAKPINLLLQGSPFKLQVWEALLRVPESSVCSYQNIAQAMHRPSATRAVASAIGANRIAYLIPCHRVIRSTGALSQYRWGASRKAAMIACEQRVKG